MSFEDFKGRLLPIAKANETDVVFRKENGKYIAEFSDDTVVTCNRYADRIAVTWGSGHHAYATI